MAPQTSASCSLGQSVSFLQPIILSPTTSASQTSIVPTLCRRIWRLVSNLEWLIFASYNKYYKYIKTKPQRKTLSRALCNEDKKCWTLTDNTFCHYDISFVFPAIQPSFTNISSINHQLGIKESSKPTNNQFFGHANIHHSNINYSSINHSIIKSLKSSIIQASILQRITIKRNQATSNICAYKFLVSYKVLVSCSRNIFLDQELERYLLSLIIADFPLTIYFEFISDLLV